MPTKPHILVIGSSNTDLVVKVPRLPAPGETVLGGDFASVAGGKGANQAVAAARAGAAVTFVARVGDDAFGRLSLEGLRKEGIHVDYVVTDRQHPSGVALILVAPDGQNSIAVAPGANAHLTPADVHHAAAAFRSARLVVIQLEIPMPAVQSALELAAHHRVPVLLNPAPARPIPTDWFRHITFLVPNAKEAGALTGIEVTDPDTAIRAAARLRHKGVAHVIVTLGDQGVVLDAPRLHKHLPAHRVRAVDTTAAGDVFCGALAVAWTEGRPLLEAVHFAQAAAAISVTRFGAQRSAPTRAEIERFLHEHPPASAHSVPRQQV
jgi:ribokinase